jgi:hypothetical protein
MAQLRNKAAWIAVAMHFWIPQKAEIPKDKKIRKRIDKKGREE